MSYNNGTVETFFNPPLFSPFNYTGVQISVGSHGLLWLNEAKVAKLIGRACLRYFEKLYRSHYKGKNVKT